MVERRRLGPSMGLLARALRVSRAVVVQGVFNLMVAAGLVTGG
jgi:hypothetical protein